MPATVYDFRDLDLMLRIAREADATGITSADLAALIGLEEDVRAVGIRLAWMKRFGMVDYDDRDHVWKLSKGGERVTEARIRAAQGRALDELPDESMIEVMAHVTSRYHSGSPLVANLLRREFLFGTRKR